MKSKVEGSLIFVMFFALRVFVFFVCKKGFSVCLFIFLISFSFLFHVFRGIVFGMLFLISFSPLLIFMFFILRVSFSLFSCSIFQKKKIVFLEEQGQGFPHLRVVPFCFNVYVFHFFNYLFFSISQCFHIFSS